MGCPHPPLEECKEIAEPHRATKKRLTHLLLNPPTSSLTIFNVFFLPATAVFLQGSASGGRSPLNQLMNQSQFQLGSARRIGNGRKFCQVMLS
eukprot:Skav220502  [mRNA]  locus=scaffold4697:67268:67546:+ [translate_table: standard]